MNIAIVLAGGDKSIEKGGVPIQFMSIFDKPLIIYTLEAFQNHPQIDCIEVVCKAGWENALEAFSKQFGITKLRWIVDGGNTAQESIRNGLFNIKTNLTEHDIVILHDGNRPLMDDDVLTDVVNVATQKGNAVSATDYKEQLFFPDSDDVSTTRYINRNMIRSVTTPQAYRYGELHDAYRTAFKKEISIDRDSYADTMMVEQGYSLYFAYGSDRNLKIESKEDIELFKAIITGD